MTNVVYLQHCATAREKAQDHEWHRPFVDEEEEAIDLKLAASLPTCYNTRLAYDKHTNDSPPMDANGQGRNEQREKGTRDSSTARFVIKQLTLMKCRSLVEQH